MKLADFSIQSRMRPIKILKTFKRLPGVRPLARCLRLSSKDADPRAFLLRRFPGGSIGAEIGVHKGEFSERILRKVKPRKLHLIDPWKYESSDEYRNALYGRKAKGGQVEMDQLYDDVCNRLDRDIRVGRVTIHRGCSSDVCGGFPDEYFDWVYIDGNHLYEFVKQDLDVFYRKVKRGGYMAGDDYMLGGWWRGGVKLAVDEFVRNMPVELVEIRNYQFILRKRLSKS
jgi:hypothetical protein